MPEAILEVANEKGVVDGSQVCVQLGDKHPSGHFLVRGEIIKGYHLPLDDIRAAEPVPEEPPEPPEPPEPVPMELEAAAEPVVHQALVPVPMEPAHPAETTEPAKQRKRKPETELDFRDAQFSDGRQNTQMVLDESDRNLEGLARTITSYKLSNRRIDSAKVFNERDGNLDALARSLPNAPV